VFGIVLGTNVRNSSFAQDLDKYILKISAFLKNNVISVKIANVLLLQNNLKFANWVLVLKLTT